MRLLGVAGPIGKGVQLVKSITNTKVATLIIDIGGPRCSWVASTKALAQTGHTLNSRLFASVDDLANAVGVPVNLTAGISIGSMAANLRMIGASIGNVRNISNISNAVKMLPRDGSVVLISVRCMSRGREVGGHALYIFYNATR